MKYASFRAIYCRAPIAGTDYDRNAPMSQDDYEYFTGTGPYADNCECHIPHVGIRVNYAGQPEHYCKKCTLPMKGYPVNA